MYLLKRLDNLEKRVFNLEKQVSSKTPVKRELPDWLPDLKELDFKRFREEKGYTIEQVVEMVGVSKFLIGPLEEGKMDNLSYNWVVKLYNFYKG